MKKPEQHNSDQQNTQTDIDQIFKEFEMGCDEAIIRREGKRLIFEPKKRQIAIPKKSECMNIEFPNTDITFFGDFRL